MIPPRLLPSFLRRRDPLTGEPVDDAPGGPLGTNTSYGSAITPPFVAPGTMTAGSPRPLRPAFAGLPTPDPLVSATRMPAAIGLQPKYGDLPLGTGAPRPGIDLLDRTRSPLDADRAAEQLGPAPTSRLRVDPREQAAYDLGPERKLGGWGKALQIAMGALAGATGQQVPEELTPYGRHRIYQAELDRRTGEYRQKEADQQEAEDRAYQMKLRPLQLQQAQQQTALTAAQTQAALTRAQGGLTPDQMQDNRRQVLAMGAPVTAEDVKQFQLPAEWVGQPLPGTGPKAAKPDNPDIRLVNNPDQSQTIWERNPATGVWSPGRTQTGDDVVSAAKPNVRTDPTAKPRARAQFLKAYPTSDEGKQLYAGVVTTAAGPLLGDTEPTPEGVQREMARIRAEINDLNRAEAYDRSVQGTQPGDVTAEGDDARGKERAGEMAARVAARKAQITELQQRYQALQQAHAAALAEQQRQAGLAFDSTYTGEEGGDGAAPTMADFDREAAARGLQPGTPEYETAKQRFTAKYGGGQ